jgi:hypothetical protein
VVVVVVVVVSSSSAAAAAASSSATCVLQVFFSISFSRKSLSGCQKSWAIWPKHFLGRSDISFPSPA